MKFFIKEQHRSQSFTKRSVIKFQWSSSLGFNFSMADLDLFYRFDIKQWLELV